MGNFVIGMLNGLIKALGAVLSLVFSFLPPSPFQALDNSPLAPYIDQLNWLIPVSQMLVIAEAWLAAIAIYYVQQIVLRWLKAVE